MISPRMNAGFSLIELMIVVAVIGIVSMIVVPKMSDLIQKGNEAGTRGHLNAVRGAIRIYFLDNDEVHPADIDPVLAPGSKFYSGTRPTVYTARHGKRQVINQSAALAPNADSGEWGYVNNPADEAFGTFWIQCIHTDMLGKVWSQY